MKRFFSSSCCLLSLPPPGAAGFWFFALAMTACSCVSASSAALARLCSNAGAAFDAPDAAFMAATAAVALAPCSDLRIFSTAAANSSAAAAASLTAPRRFFRLPLLAASSFFSAASASAAAVTALGVEQREVHRRIGLVEIPGGVDQLGDVLRQLFFEALVLRRAPSSACSRCRCSGARECRWSWRLFLGWARWRRRLHEPRNDGQAVNPSQASPFGGERVTNRIHLWAKVPRRANNPAAPGAGPLNTMRCCCKGDVRARALPSDDHPAAKPH